MNAFEVVTNQILGILEKGTIPWRKTWSVSQPRSYFTGKPYRGINAFILACMPYSSSFWLTYRTAKAKGGHVKKGEKGTPVVYWNWIRKTDAEGNEKMIPFLRYYTVFNLDQCEGVPAPRFQVKAQGHNGERIAKCEGIVSGYANGPKISHGGERASYCPPLDSVQMPAFESFESPEAYYATLFHELTHSTGHASRLNRPEVVQAQSFGSYNYGCEELTAEMGAAFLCMMVEIDSVTVENSAAYIASWIKKIKEDPKMVIYAASKARKAVELIAGKEEEEESEN